MFKPMQFEEGSTKRRPKMMIAIAAVFVLAAAAFSLALVDLTRQEGGAEPSTNPASPFSPNSPDPELLRWNEPKAAPSVGRYKVMERTGKLTVPLSYDDVDTPFLDLTVVSVCTSDPCDLAEKLFGRVGMEAFRLGP